MAFLKCHGCNESLDDGSHKPYVLKCGDTLCKNCVISKRSFVNCPQCPSWQQTNNGINDLAVNYTLLDFINLDKNTKELMVASSRVRNKLLNVTDKRNKYSKAIAYHNYQIEELTKIKKDLMEYKEKQIDSMKLKDSNDVNEDEKEFTINSDGEKQYTELDVNYCNSKNTLNIVDKEIMTVRSKITGKNNVNRNLNHRRRSQEISLLVIEEINEEKETEPLESTEEDVIHPNVDNSTTGDASSTSNSDVESNNLPNQAGMLEDVHIIEQTETTVNEINVSQNTNDLNQTSQTINNSETNSNDTNESNPENNNLADTSQPQDGSEPTIAQNNDSVNTSESAQATDDVQNTIESKGKETKEEEEVPAPENKKPINILELLFRDYTSLRVCGSIGDRPFHSKVTFNNNLVHLHCLEESKCDEKPPCTLQFDDMKRLVCSRNYFPFFDLTFDGFKQGRIYIKTFDCSLSALLEIVFLGHVVARSSLKSNVIRPVSKKKVEEKTKPIVEVELPNLRSFFGEDELPELESEVEVEQEIKTPLEDKVIYKDNITRILETFESKNDTFAVVLKPTSNVDGIYKYAFKNMTGKRGTVVKKIVTFSNDGELMIHLQDDLHNFVNKAVGWVVEGFEYLLDVAVEDQVKKYKISDCGLAYNIYEQ